MHHKISEKRPLRVLLVGDSEDDAELTVLALRSGVINLVAQRVDIETDYLAALHLRAI